MSHTSVHFMCLGTDSRGKLHVSPPTNMPKNAVSKIMVLCSDFCKFEATAVLGCGRTRSPSSRWSRGGGSVRLPVCCPKVCTPFPIFGA
eukprot:3372896-Rhodomonas_salina.3